MNKTNTVCSDPSSRGPSISEQQDMHELLDNAIANGAAGSIPQHLMLAARKNPLLDWNAPLKEVLTRRSIQIGNRRYSTCLVGIPLNGDLGMAFEQVATVPEILKDAQKEKLLAKDEGLIFLDAPLPRSTIQMMSLEDIYHLTPRLFERGVRGSPHPVLDAKITESESRAIDAGLLIGLLYWKADHPAPLLLTDQTSQVKMGKLVERHLAFERATPFAPTPLIQSQPMVPLLDATISSSRNITHRYVASLLAQSAPAEGALFTVVASGVPWGDYQIEIMLQTRNGFADNRMVLSLDELRDGNINDTLKFLQSEFLSHGITECRIEYHYASFTDCDEPTHAIMALH